MWYGSYKKNLTLQYMYKLESNPLHDEFFSNENYSRIIQLTRQKVYGRTGNDIDPASQNFFDLYNTMWSVYSVNSYNYSGDIQRQVNTMNSIIVDKISDQIVSGILMYKQYVKDIYTGPIPNRLPVSTTQYGKKIGVGTKL